MISPKKHYSSRRMHSPKHRSFAKKVLYFLLMCGLLSAVVLAIWSFTNETWPFTKNGSSISSSKNNITSNTTSDTKRSTYPRKNANTLTNSLFVPYWMVQIPIQNPQLSNASKLDTLIYFGIAPSDSIDAPIQKNEAGYAQLQAFTALQQPNLSTLLTIRMTNIDTNEKILANNSLQTAIIDESIAIAKQHNFNGLVLDLEHSVLPTKNTTDAITSFTQQFADASHRNNLQFDITLYGDTFYRTRPYDVSALSQSADHILIMTYDFHKTMGPPGPQFPLFTYDKNGKQTYPYSLETLLSDFYAANVPPEKLIFIFGLYGYEWLVDNENRPLKRATPYTLQQIRTRSARLSNDAQSDFVQHIDPQTHEPHFTYTADQNNPEYKSVLWYENEASVDKKIDMLKKYGIQSYGFWASGYY